MILNTKQSNECGNASLVKGRIDRIVSNHYKNTTDIFTVY